MDINEILASRRGEILGDALDRLRRAHLSHYDEGRSAATRDRLEYLYRLMMAGVSNRNATQLLKYAQAIGKERHEAGFHLVELQTAFNVLGEAVWSQVLKDAAPDQLADALGVTSTILGMGKDEIARAFVSQAHPTPVPSIDPQRLN